MYWLEELVSNLTGSSSKADTSDLETKTQNISLADLDTDQSKTTFPGEFNADTALVGGAESIFFIDEDCKVNLSMVIHNSLTCIIIRNSVKMFAKLIWTAAV